MYMSMDRRGALKTFGALSAGGAVSALAGWASLRFSQQRSARRRALRVAHLTDVHVHPSGNSMSGLAACLRHVQSHGKPDAILQGGDAILDGTAHDDVEVGGQWDAWKTVWHTEDHAPIEHCLGNHDLWGGKRKGGKTSGADRTYGKQWAMDEYGLSECYRGFDLGSWHFVVLDSVLPAGDGYRARLDDEQFEWLVAELAATPRNTPVLILSHIPILSACAYFDGDNEKTNDWVVPGAWMHLDARRLRDLFAQHPNVKLCLSGHIHLQDCVCYQGVTYLCNGAVSGNWWRGAYQGCEPGYGMIGLYDDGTFEHEYVAYRAGIGLGGF